jgi:hypothetical protein
MNSKIRFITPILTVAIVLIGLSSCQDKTKSSKESEKKSLTIGNSTISEPAIDNYVQQIDAIPEEEMPYLSSLHYLNDYEDIQVKAFLKDSVVVKIVEGFIDNTNHTFGRRIYYMQDDNLVFVREIIQEPTADSMGQMRETISYYKNGHVSKSAEKTANFEEDLDATNFISCAKKQMPFDNLVALMNREGKYTTNFLGFIKAGDFQFLWLGENDKEGLTTTLLIDYQDKFIADLLKDPTKNLGKHMDVNFEPSTIQGITYQVYRGGSFTK